MSSRAFLAPLFALALVACSDSRRSPTEPFPTDGGLGTASVHGSVTVQAPKSTGTGGVTVTVRGTTLQTTTDVTGHYQLDSVPHGNQVLVFESNDISGALMVENIQPQEDIGLDVRVTPGNVEVQQMTRSSSPDAGALDPSALSAELAPDHWNLNFDGSSGSVEAFIRGEGIDLIDLDSIELVGDDPDADPLPAFDASRQGNHVRARFAKSGVLSLLDDPEAGSTHTVLVSFLATDESGPYELAVTVTVEGDDEDDGEDDGEDDDEPPVVVNLNLEIQPQKWNTNFSNGNGTVSALLRGSGYELIDLGSIKLSGTNPSVAAVPAQSASLQGNHVRARWSQSSAFRTLNNPKRGETHTVTVSFTVDGQQQALTFGVEIVGR